MIISRVCGNSANNFSGTAEWSSFQQYFIIFFIFKLARTFGTMRPFLSHASVSSTSTYVIVVVYGLKTKLGKLFSASKCSANGVVAVVVVVGAAG